MREKLYRFMQGRYGSDQLNRFLLWLMVGMVVINLFLGSSVFYLLSVIVLVVSYYRMFSRNLYKRSAENDKYLELKRRVQSFFSNTFDRNGCHAKFNTNGSNIIDESKLYRIFKCPSCGQKLRVPKGKGKICISCKRCGNSFIKRT